MYPSACNPVGSLFYPAPQASPAGPYYSPPWLGARAQGEGDQLVGAQGLEKRRRHELVLPASNVTPRANTAASSRMAWLLGKTTGQPTHSWAGAEGSQGSGQCSGEGNALALSGFCCPIWLPARLTQLLGKGPCSLPQAPHSRPSDTHQEKRAWQDPLSYLKPTQEPPAQLEQWWGEGPHLRTSSFFSQLLPH